jgi:CBS domain-containing protein
MNVASILKSKGGAITTASRDTRVEAIAGLLAKHRIGAVVIVSPEGRVEGIVSERDIVKAIAERGSMCLDEIADAIMTREVITCDPDEPLDRLMSTMTTGRFRHVPVVEAGRLTGIVSIGDAVKYKIAEVELEANALKSYVLAGQG